MLKNLFCCYEVEILVNLINDDDMRASAPLELINGGLLPYERLLIAVARWQARRRAFKYNVLQTLVGENTPVGLARVKKK